MPYPNYHAARLKSPGLFIRIRVFNTSKEGIMFYGGPLKSKPQGGTVLQAIRFPKSKFTTLQAKQWLKDHKYKPILFEPATNVKKGECLFDGLFDLLMKRSPYGGRKEKER